MVHVRVLIYISGSYRACECGYCSWMRVIKVSRRKASEYLGFLWGQAPLPICWYPYPSFFWQAYLRLFQGPHLTAPLLSRAMTSFAAEIQPGLTVQIPNAAILNPSPREALVHQVSRTWYYQRSCWAPHLPTYSALSPLHCSPHCRLYNQCALSYPHCTDCSTIIVLRRLLFQRTPYF